MNLFLNTWGQGEEILNMLFKSLKRQAPIILRVLSKTPPVCLKQEPTWEYKFCTTVNVKIQKLKRNSIIFVIDSQRNNYQLKVVCDKKKPGGSASDGLGRHFFSFFILNMQFFCKNCFSVSAQYWVNIRRFLTIGNAHRTDSSQL